ncbi:malto-oligosyltrehalose synthase [Desulforhabdus amnigena]|uniref:Malto-oligosyltrehalose synthase n=1 Tax=Desulforhabdus amnigena TaxID=40218 RepID=A0A9W6FU94_9BACT|nr:malto-oligosyltrehalose synthase [Desulforhabdus amnigena]GLI34983.1 malto-oligosyltrehalose synthase [Desulforhabdus amnigena]
MRIPISTYRIQFNPAFGFQDAGNILNYLEELGISDLYASPIFKARKGSMHGYDVVDPTKLNPELGNEVELDLLLTAVKDRGMGWLQDIVPNHMAFDSANEMLMDIFENGKNSRFFSCFDIDWNHTYESMKGRLLAPFLGKPFGECLEAGELKLTFGNEGFEVTYYDLRFRLNIGSYLKILGRNLDLLEQTMGKEHPDYIRFSGILYVLKVIPSHARSDERYNQIRFAKRTLWDLYREEPRIREFIDGNVQEINDEGGEGGFRELESLLRDQFFRLSYWKVASEEINYRRFFCVNELIAIRMEERKVFEDLHSLIFKLIGEKAFTGLRIDHIDGLYDPLRYLRRLKAGSGGIYVVVEKILASKEELPPEWPVAGTTGYEFMNLVNGLFCQREHEKAFDKIYAAFIRDKIHFEKLLLEKKGTIIERFMLGDVDNLAHLMKRISSRDRAGCDITLYGLKRALYEMLRNFPVYRTYIGADSFSEPDRRSIQEAFDKAKKQHPDLFHELNYVYKFLMLQYEDYMEKEEKNAWLHFVMRFQQFSGPLMAKGFEDTALYVYNRLISLNEVGGEPQVFGIPLEEFHDFNVHRMKRWPHALSATSTHDTKRGEDVRARINVLSEIPGEWAARVNAWRRLNRGHKKRLKGKRAPTRNDEYFLYQTLVGAFPFDEAELPGFVTRLKDYIVKAVREAKEHTGWIKTDVDYENACLAFIDRLMTPSGDNPFLQDFLPFQKKIAHFGIINSLSQTLVKITAPGVPDFYQGTELWELSLVDPDNRRPVDYARRRGYLAEIKQNEGRPGYVAELLSHPSDGKVKLFLVYKALRERKRNRRLYERGDYIALESRGKYREHVIAYARQKGNCRALTVVPRFSSHLVEEGRYPTGEELWDDTTVILPGDFPFPWENVLTGEMVEGRASLPVGLLLESFPAGFFVNAGRQRTKKTLHSSSNTASQKRNRAVHRDSIS